MTNQAIAEIDDISAVTRIGPPAPTTDPVVEELVDRALAAQRRIEDWSEARIDALLLSLATVVADQAHALAVATVAETGMGNVRDKTLKNVIASTGIYQHLAGQIGHGEVSFDEQLQVAEFASPIGVIAGLVPATHPVATFIFEALIAIKGRNAIILSPSRRARHVSHQVGAIIRQALGVADAPTDLVQWLGDPYSRDTTAALMSHRGIGLVLSTGGVAMVHASYRSGTAATRVGPGNAPALISADADLRHAARCVVMSKSFDNGLIYGAESHLVVEAGARAQLVAELTQQGAAVLTRDESARFQDEAVDPRTGQFTSRIVGQDAATLARLARIERPYDIQLLVVPTDSVTAGNYLAGEKLAPVTTLLTVANTDDGINMCRRLLETDSMGHTAIIHSLDVDLIQRFSTAIPASRIIVSAPATQGLMGIASGLVPSLSLACGKWGGNSTTNSVTYRDLLKVKRVAYYHPNAACR